MMKQIVYGDSRGMSFFAWLVACSNAVKVTLEPMRRNSALDKQFASRTEDSVTVAREIDLKDALQNIGVPMVNHAVDMPCLFKPPPAPTCELLFEFRIHHGTVACELRCHGEREVEARFVDSEGRVCLHQRFTTRALAVEWAEEAQRAMERME